MVQLRKVCNHPYLFNISDEENQGSESTDSNSLPEIVNWSGKMLLLERLLPALFEKGHKVLIFCKTFTVPTLLAQMTRMLDILSDWFEFVKGWKFCRIDGQIKIDDRRTQIDDFNNNPELKLFLLSTRSGGLGINLTSADTVIIFDSDWYLQHF